MLPLAVLSIARTDPDWRSLTTEVYRIDEKTLDSTRDKTVHPFMLVCTLLQRVYAWIANFLCNKNCFACLKLTKHLIRRAKNYENAKSRCKNYIELLPEEREIIESITTKFVASSTYKIVELGLNSIGNVCKIALLVPFDQWLQNGTTRKLFMVVGCDGGIKTFYVVPDLKIRKNYQAKDQTVSLSLSQLISESNAWLQNNCTFDFYIEFGKSIIKRIDRVLERGEQTCETKKR